MIKIITREIKSAHVQLIKNNCVVVKIPRKLIKLRDNNVTVCGFPNMIIQRRHISAVDNKFYQLSYT